MSGIQVHLVKAGGDNSGFAHKHPLLVDALGATAGAVGVTGLAVNALSKATDCVFADGPGSGYPDC